MLDNYRRYHNIFHISIQKSEPSTAFATYQSLSSFIAHHDQNFGQLRCATLTQPIFPGAAAISVFAVGS
jgi:hypothetical protein